MKGGPVTQLSTLVAVADADRFPADVDLGNGVEVLEPTALLPSQVRSRLPQARDLIVDDALAFPFEAFREEDWDIPLSVRFGANLDPDDWLAVLGADVLSNMTPFDVASGSLQMWSRVCNRYRLDTGMRVGDPTLSVQQIVNRSRALWRDLERSSYPTAPPPGAPIAVTEGPPAPYLPGGRLRAAKAKYRFEREHLRAALEGAMELQPRTRDVKAAVVAHTPRLWASAFSAQVLALTGVRLATSQQEPTDATPPIFDRQLQVEGALRLDLAPGSLDIVTVVADIASNPTHVLIRLFEELVRSIRPAGWLVVMTEVVPNEERLQKAVQWTGPNDLVELVSSASGRTVNLYDARALRRPGEDHHHAVLLTFQCLASRHGA